MMKKNLSLLLALWCFVGIASAQPKTVTSSKGQVRIEQQVAHYVERFALTANQTDLFTTIYRNYNKQLRALRLRYQRSDTSHVALTEEQIEQRIIDNFALSRAILDVREQYYKEFRKVLTPSQIRVIFEDEKVRREQVKSHRNQS